MKHFITSLFLLVIVVCATAQKNEVLNNKSIIELSKAGMSKKIILSKIDNSTCKFTTDTQALISLKKSGVEEDIIDAMVNKMSASSSSPATTPSPGSVTASSKEKGGSNAVTETPAADDKSSSHISPLAAPKVIASLKKEGSGVYYYNPTNNNIDELETTVFSQEKENGWGKAFTPGGFGKSSKVMSVSGKEANVQFKEKLPVIYFYFDPENKSLNSQAPTWFASVTSPNEFLLIKFETKVKNSRAVTTASGNSYQSAQGIDDKYKRTFKFKKLEKGIYEIYFEGASLEPGEYGFMYAGATATNGGGSPKVYDFGVK
jgi:hypothetical protein